MNKHELYERILKLVEQSNIKEENGSYIIKLTNNKELFPYSNKIFMVEIDIGENEFIVEDQKLTGTQTYTRATINSITLNGEKLNFRIVQE